MTWKQIPGYPDYEISTEGQVRRISTARGTYAGRLLKGVVDPQTGYRRVYMNGQKRYVHRLMALAYMDPPEGEAWEVDHHDQDHLNNHLDNLILREGRSDHMFEHSTVDGKLASRIKSQEDGGMRRGGRLSRFF